MYDKPCTSQGTHESCIMMIHELPKRNQTTATIDDRLKFILIKV